MPDMMHIEVLGFDCSTCRKAHQIIEEVAQELGIDIELEKVSDPARITAYRVLSVPGFAINGKLVHSGSSLTRKTVTNWLTIPAGK
jgi:thiol-disulfide isomerase/thioredoxin